MVHNYLKSVRKPEIGRIIVRLRKFERLIGYRCCALVIAPVTGSVTCG